MILRLNRDPHSEIKPVAHTHPYGRSITLMGQDPAGHSQHITIGSHDFCHLVKYFLTNTDLYDGDPRRVLINEIREGGEVQGYNGENTRRFEMREPVEEINEMEFGLQPNPVSYVPCTVESNGVTFGASMILGQHGNGTPLILFHVHAGAHYIVTQTKQALGWLRSHGCGDEEAVNLIQKALAHCQAETAIREARMRLPPTDLLTAQLSNLAEMTICVLKELGKSEDPSIVEELRETLVDFQTKMVALNKKLAELEKSEKSKKSEKSDN